MDDGFAAGDKGQRTRALGQIGRNNIGIGIEISIEISIGSGIRIGIRSVCAEDARQKAAGFSGFAAELIRQQDRFVTEMAAGCRGSGTEFANAAGDLGGHIVQHFGRFLRQTGLRLRTELEAVFTCDLRSLRGSGSIRVSGPAGDHIERVADDIAEYDAVNPGGRAQLGKAPALDRRQPLADRVDLPDIRSAGKQLLRDILQFFCRDQRLLKKRAAAAGEQEQHRIFFR